MTDHAFKIGETIALTIDAEGDVSSFGLPVVKMQRLSGGAASFDPDGAETIPFTVTARAPVVGVPDGWNCRISAETSLTLVPGRYVVDAACPLGTDWVATPDIIITLNGSAARNG